MADIFALHPEGARPSERGDFAEVDEHTLEAVEGRVPANDLVWVCTRCGLRSTGHAIYQREVCDADE